MRWQRSRRDAHSRPTRGTARGRRVRPGNRRRRSRETATLTWSSSGRRFLSAPPEVAVLPTADGPKVRAGECGTSVPTVGGRMLRLESGHRSNLSVLVMDARPLHPCRPGRGVRHRARGCAGTLQVGGCSGCGHLQLCHLGILMRAALAFLAPRVAASPVTVPFA